MLGCDHRLRPPAKADSSNCHQQTPAARADDGIQVDGTSSLHLGWEMR